jgi:hypothetical protein
MTLARLVLGEPVIDSAEDPNLLLERGELFTGDFEGSGPLVLTGPGSKRPRQKDFGNFDT